MLIFLSCPISNGDMATDTEIEKNVAVAIAYETVLRDLEFAVVNPALSWFSHKFRPWSHDRWMEQAIDTMLRCDAVLRVPGDSVGADREQAFAETHDLPYFESVACLLEHERESRRAAAEEAGEILPD
jgi:hypothetical protein